MQRELWQFPPVARHTQVDTLFPGSQVSVKRPEVPKLDSNTVHKKFSRCFIQKFVIGRYVIKRASFCSSTNYVFVLTSCLPPAVRQTHLCEVIRLDRSSARVRPCPDRFSLVLKV